jgi:serine/threonine-protein kinase
MDFGIPDLPFNVADGRYQVTALVAEGGTARVFVAYDNQTRAWRALKMLLPEYAQRPDLRRRLITEATAMQRLDHMHITKVFEAIEDDTNVYLVMEYAERGSIGDWIRANGALPAPAAAEIAVQVCRAVAHAHDCGIVHRDIKPHNVLVDGRGLCSVADFGIAQVTWEERQTRTGAALGTLGYIAPEQLDSAKHVDSRADVYSIGATLYMFLAGAPPRDLFMHNASSDLFAGLPEPLLDLIVRTTRHFRGDRLQSVHHLLEELLEAQGELPPLDPGFALLAPPKAPPVPKGLKGITPNRLGSAFSSKSDSQPPTFNLDGNPRTVKPKERET